MAELQLIRFVGGLGNRNHDHVHRHNMLNLESRDADLLKTEDYSGGILPSTLAGVADRSAHSVRRLRRSGRSPTTHARPLRDAGHLHDRLRGRGCTVHHLAQPVAAQ